jgi:hypothetical protein
VIACGRELPNNRLNNPLLIAPHHFAYLSYAPSITPQGPWFQALMPSRLPRRGGVMPLRIPPEGVDRQGKEGGRRFFIWLGGEAGLPLKYSQGDLRGHTRR